MCDLDGRRRCCGVRSDIVGGVTFAVALTHAVAAAVSALTLAVPLAQLIPSGGSGRRHGEDRVGSLPWVMIRGGGRHGGHELGVVKVEGVCRVRLADELGWKGWSGWREKVGSDGMSATNRSQSFAVADANLISVLGFPLLVLSTMK